MMFEQNISFFDESENVENFLIILNEDAQLPFPINLSYSFRLLICLTMTTVFLSGLYYRIFIFKYLRQPDTNMGPINLLIWTDQLNGLFLGINTIGRIIALALPFPMSKIIGETFCKWTPFPGNILKLCLGYDHLAVLT
jgi:hypothetical protein